MTSHTSLSGAAGGSILGGFAGLFASWMQLVNLQAFSNAFSAACVIVGGCILVYRNVNKAKLDKHNDEVESNSREIHILNTRVFDLIQENVKLSQELIATNKKMIEMSIQNTAGCQVSQSLLRQLRETGKTVELKDKPHGTEAEGTAADQ